MQTATGSLIKFLINFVFQDNRNKYRDKAITADSYFPYSSNPVFMRGGNYGNSNAGLAYFNYNDGNANSNYGFRACSGLIAR